MLEKFFLDIKNALVERIEDYARSVEQNQDLETLVKELSDQVIKLKLLEIALRNYSELSTQEKKSMSQEVNDMVRKGKRS